MSIDTSRICVEMYMEETCDLSSSIYNLNSSKFGEIVYRGICFAAHMTQLKL